MCVVAPRDATAIVFRAGLTTFLSEGAGAKIFIGDSFAGNISLRCEFFGSRHRWRLHSNRVDRGDNRRGDANTQRTSEKHAERKARSLEGTEHVVMNLSDERVHHSAFLTRTLTPPADRLWWRVAPE
jgi:hypothetical protein